MYEVNSSLLVLLYVYTEDPSPSVYHPKIRIQAYIKRTGQYLCSMSWEGHEEMGRGAIFANYDDARKEEKLNDVSYIKHSSEFYHLLLSGVMVRNREQTC